MSLKEKLKQDFMEAFKAKEIVKTSVFKMLQSEIKNTEISKGRELDDETILRIIGKEAKKRKDAFEIYEKQGRAELAEIEKAELEILSGYLPELMKESEIRALAKEAIKESNATAPRDIGKVMEILAPKTKSKADGALVNAIVKELLA